MLMFWMWVLLLTALLFYPVAQLIWVVTVRRLQRKLHRELDEGELAAQKQRARFIALIVSFAFSTLYNISTLGLPTHG